MKPSSRWLPFLQWPRLTPALARSEVLAGITVGLVMVPQAVAYAGLAHMPLVTGLYACLLPALLAVLFGSSNRISVGPAALTCVLIGASLYGLAEPGSPEWVSLAVWLSFLSGALQLGLGLGGYGWLLNLISAPVLMGFTQAASLLIMASQLPALLGVKLSLDTLPSVSELLNPAALWGLASLALLLLARRLRPRWPSIMLVVALSAALSAITGYGNVGAVVGALPAGCPACTGPIGQAGKCFKNCWCRPW